MRPSLKSKFLAPLALASGLALAAPAGAHHSHAMFENEVFVTLEATVNSVRYANPHVYLFLSVVQDDGSVQEWAVEMSHVGNMQNRGVYGTTIQAGDTIVIEGNPLRNGGPAINYSRIHSINGVENAASGSNWEAAETAAEEAAAE